MSEKARVLCVIPDDTPPPLKKGDLVFFTYPNGMRLYGVVQRCAKDESWADVRWREDDAPPGLPKEWVKRAPQGEICKG